MTEKSKKLDKAINFVEKGDYPRALDIFQSLYRQYPVDVDVLFNFGIFSNEMRDFIGSSKMLNELITIQPDYPNAKVALGFAYIQLNRPDDAEKILEDVLICDPQNLFALRNLGTIYAKRGDLEDAVNIFKKAELIDPSSRHILYGIALALFRQEKYSESSDYLTRILDENLDDEFDNLAKELKREISGKVFAQDGLRMDAVQYCLGALEKFNEMSFSQIQNIAFEIALLGSKGLDPSTPNIKYQLNSMPGDYSALHLLCYMYVGFKIVKPDVDIGFDLSKEYATAIKMFNP